MKRNEFPSAFNNCFYCFETLSCCCLVVAGSAFADIYRMRSYIYVGNDFRTLQSGYGKIIIITMTKTITNIINYTHCFYAYANNFDRMQSDYYSFYAFDDTTGNLFEAHKHIINAFSVYHQTH